MLENTVHILLATYNGARFLQEQLNSIAEQSHSNWTLTVSDDGSSDETCTMIGEFSKKVLQPVRLINGPGLGSTENFFHLLHKVFTADANDLFAFCDQDDVWLETKLARAVQWHASLGHQRAALYCGKTHYVDEGLRPLGVSPSLSHSPCFSNALVQNIASGNTMVMNAHLRSGLLMVKPEHSVWHDWTSYLVVTAMGGNVGFDEVPGVLYRQHSANVVGSNHGFMAQLKRLGPVWSGRYKRWTDNNLQSIRDIRTVISAEAADCMANFEHMRRASSALERMRMFRNSSVRRQGLASNASLLFALIVNRV